MEVSSSLVEEECTQLNQEYEQLHNGQYNHAEKLKYIDRRENVGALHT